MMTTKIPLAYLLVINICHFPPSRVLHRPVVSITVSPSYKFAGANHHLIH